MPIQVHPFEEIPDVWRIQATVYRDERGWFMESYKASDFHANGLPTALVQDSHSRSEQPGVVRGLHFQMAPKAQGKLVRCTLGRIFDVALDIRESSDTFGRHVSCELTANEGTQLWIPPGFAHGFCVLEAPAEVQYKTTNEYSPKHERTVRWNDPEVGIRWPVESPLLSSKDATAPTLQEAMAQGWTAH